MGAGTAIRVKRETRDKLRALKSRGETYDDVVRRLLGRQELAELLEDHFRLIEEKEQFIPLDDL